MKRYISLLILFTFISLLFSGCSFRFKPANELIRPPMLSGENVYLQQAFEDSAGSDMNLIAPLNGDYRSSYLIYDLNRDGSDEALVFYSAPGTDKNVNIAFFTFNNDSWVLTDTLKESVSNIYEVSFSDISGNGYDELLVSYSDGNAGNNSNTLSDNGAIELNIYSFNGTSLTLQKTDYYDNLYVSDINSNGNSDIFLFYSDFSGENNEPRINGKLLSFGNDFSILTNTEFSLQNIIEILSVATDNFVIDEDKFTRIYIDGLIGEGSVVTNVLSINSKTNEISNLLDLYKTDDGNALSTLRSSRIYSADINNDGVIEIPTTEILHGGKVINTDSTEVQLNLVVWSKLTEEGFDVVFRCVYNSSQKYMLVFPNEWMAKYSAVYNNNSQTLFVYSKETGKDLFSVRAFPTAIWEDNNWDYSVIKSNDIYTYGYSIYSDDAKNMTAEIVSNFYVME